MYEDSILIFKCLADASRLRIIKHLLKGPMYVELLSEVLGITNATVSFHLKKLEEAKLVVSKKEQYYMMYSLKDDLLNQPIIHFIQNLKEEDDINREEAYREKVLKSFFQYGKLKSIPVQMKKRKIILEEIAKRFDENSEYAEKEVNLIIAEFHDDFCTLRRDLIDYQLMVRKDGIYKLKK